MQPLSVAVQGKGPVGMLKRARVIQATYGVTAEKMERILTHFAGILSEFRCGATFPITTAALARSSDLINKYLAQDIEFAVHGYYHIDHSQLPLDEQLAHFERARRVFAESGVQAQGFRSPYLRWNEATLSAAAQAGFLYDGSQALAWDVVRDGTTEPYEHVLDFYGALPAEAYPALPRWDNGLLRIPYCLPDDEALVDRLRLMAPRAMAEPWQAILERTYALGELFTLGLHPERIHHCEQSLAATLRAARALSPQVWITRLDQAASWWMARMKTHIDVATDGENTYHISVGGPEGTTLLARGFPLMTEASPWDDVYQRVHGAELHLQAERRPFIAVSPTSSPYLVSFLRQQGYITEEATDGRYHTLFLDRPVFRYEDERPLLAEIERDSSPLVRLCRWPDGARSALVITGDIDALTIWDYGLRFLGN